MFSRKSLRFDSEALSQRFIQQTIPLQTLLEPKALKRLINASLEEKLGNLENWCVAYFYHDKKLHIGALDRALFDGHNAKSIKVDEFEFSDSHKNPKLHMFALIVLPIILLVFVVFVYQTHSLKKRTRNALNTLSSLQNQISKYPLADQPTILNEKHKLLSENIAKAVSAENNLLQTQMILSSIAKHTPPLIRLQTLTLDNGELIIQGIAKSNQLLEQWLWQLGSSIKAKHSTILNVKSMGSALNFEVKYEDMAR